MRAPVNVNVREIDFAVALRTDRLHSRCTYKRRPRALISQNKTLPVLKNPIRNKPYTLSMLLPISV